MAYVDFLLKLHRSTKRDYVARVVENDKAECAVVAKQYGKDYWDKHRKVFNAIEFQAALDGAIQWGRNEHTFFALTKFLDYGRLGFTEEFVNDVCEFALSKSPK